MAPAAGEEGGEVNASTPVIEEAQANVGATVMGRNMFRGGPGPWSRDPPWKGWWGDNPPFHTPVFVLTHHPREPLEMEGGTTFFFVTDGIESAYKQAKQGRRRPRCAARRGRQRRPAVPRRRTGSTSSSCTSSRSCSGTASRLLEHVGDLQVEQVRAVEAPGVTHIKYRVVRDR